MTAAGRYLLCYAGRYAFLLRADAVLHIWERADAAPAELSDCEPIEMLGLLGHGAQVDGVAVGVKTEAEAHVLIVDKVGGFSYIDDAEFVELPRVFDFAGKFFDAACSRAIAGVHALRLRQDAPLAGDQAPPRPL